MKKLESRVDPGFLFIKMAVFDLIFVWKVSFIRLPLHREVEQR